MLVILKSFSNKTKFKDVNNKNYGYREIIMIGISFLDLAKFSVLLNFSNANLKCSGITIFSVN